MNGTYGTYRNRGLYKPHKSYKPYSFGRRMNIPEEIISRARQIKLLLMDCDGVLTDGGLQYTFDGKRVLEGVKVFHIHDGQGLKLAREAGLKLGIISGRVSPALTARARELQIDHLHQGVDDKLLV